MFLLLNAGAASRPAVDSPAMPSRAAYGTSLQTVTVVSRVSWMPTIWTVLAVPDLATLDRPVATVAATGDRRRRLRRPSGRACRSSRFGLGDRAFPRQSMRSRILSTTRSHRADLCASLNVLKGLEGGCGDHGGMSSPEGSHSCRSSSRIFSSTSQGSPRPSTLSVLLRNTTRAGNADLLPAGCGSLGRAMGRRWRPPPKLRRSNLGGAGDHVLHVVGVTRGSPRGRVTALGFVTRRGAGIDGDPPLFLLRSRRQCFVIGLELRLADGRQHVGDGRSKGGLVPWFNVADGAGC